MSMNPYTPQEKESIAKQCELNTKMELWLETKRSDLTSTIEPLFVMIKEDFNIGNAPKIVDIQATALTIRQRLTEEISYFMGKRSKDQVQIKIVRQEKFIFYSTGFGIKTNLGEKAILIDAHIAELTRGIEIYENYIEFLRACNKNLESLGFTIKNIIDLHNYLGK